MSQTVMFGLEEAPAKRGYMPKVATRCCVCGRTLTDATSIQFGIGPVCRGRYNYEDAYPVSEETAEAVLEFLRDHTAVLPDALVDEVVKACREDNSRRAANVLVYYASATQGHPAVMSAHVLRLLGYDLLADKIHDRLLRIQIADAGEINGVPMLAVKTPFNGRFVALVRRIAGRRYDRPNKRNLIPATPDAKRALFNALRDVFPGYSAVGPKGPFSL